MTSALPEPAAVEVLANLLMGPSSAGGRSLPPPPADGVRGALERAVLPALRHPPCVVSFSGGRDSSAVLALAVEVARRHGLADPVPATMRFSGAPETDETAWQDLVLGHVGIGVAEVLAVGNELDALGPIATELLHRHGLRWPANAYMHAPILRVARGGSLLTGIGGDELLATRAAPHVLLARDPARRGPRALRAAAAAALPRQLREVRLRRASSPVRWLTPAGNLLLAQTLAREETGWPSRWDASVAHWYRSRAFAAVEGAVALVAEDANVSVVNPLIDPAVLAALADAGGPTGFPSREAAMRAVFGHLLPDAVLDRPTKAAFSTPFWGPATRAFAAGWDGTGVEPEHVDVQALRREWAAPHPDFRTALLLHAAWLFGHGGRPDSAKRSEQLSCSRLERLDASRPDEAPGRQPGEFQ